MACVSSHRCLGSLVVRKKEFRLKRFISLEEINLSRQKQNYRFYLFDKPWNFSVKHVIYEHPSSTQLKNNNVIMNHSFKYIYLCLAYRSFDFSPIAIIIFALSVTTECYAIHV